jgi:3D (Asp-Asp-Asp) domain-containing protein
MVCRGILRLAEMAGDAPGREFRFRGDSRDGGLTPGWGRGDVTGPVPGAGFGWLMVSSFFPKCFSAGLAFALLAAIPGFVRADGPGPAAPSPQSPLLIRGVRTTAYTHTEADHLPYGNRSALGTELRYTPEYHSVAADWSRFPLGTKFRIRGYDRIFVVDDYGSALVGTHTIDLYFPDADRMKNWGLRFVDLEVLSFGSFHESRKILASRAKNRYCLAMLASMTTDDWYLTHR